SVGYRVKSHRGTQFRIWATQRLREYIVKGFTLDDERLKRAGGGNYFDELLARIRDIRSSEKVFYRKVLEIYATSIDYDPRAEASQAFFKTVQSKMHWAAHGQTAAEVVARRADSKRPNMGLTSWSGGRVRKTDVGVAKNYLRADEIEALNRIVNAYLEFAELQALNRKPMYMAEWIRKLDDFLRLSDREILTHSGKVSHDDAVAKDEVDDLVSAYGHVVVDECHHVPAVSFERVMRETKARYVTGLTATPQRRDGQVSLPSIVHTNRRHPFGALKRTTAELLQLYVPESKRGP